MLSRVGDVAGALQWIDKALSRPLGLVDPFHAQCEILAVHGDPTAALHALDRLPYEDGPWEPRLEWHLTVLRALALLRAGRYAEVPKVAAAALDQGARVAGAALRRDGAAEPLVLLAPLAAAAGSDVAARLLSPDHFLVHLFGAPTLRIGGDEMAVPAGKPGELFRLVAVHPGGMPAEQAIDQLWPAATPHRGAETPAQCPSSVACSRRPEPGPPRPLTTVGGFCLGRCQRVPCLGAKCRERLRHSASRRSRPRSPVPVDG